MSGPAAASGPTDLATVFDIADPLPGPGTTTLLEASAGTGKTWTIGALVTRFVAEGVASLDSMLVVTFGRAASQELRERVRSHLVEAEALLADPTAPRAASPLHALLLDADAAERAARHRRVAEALATFDAATIATTHQFCRQVLDSLGVAGDTDSRATLVEDLDDLLVEVVDDLYLRAYAFADAEPPFSHAVALGIAREAALAHPDARLEPRAAEPGSLPERRFAFATAARAELERRKRRLGVLSYDDLLSQLAQALRVPDGPARARMRQRWQVVLVDEFQDTDPVQWEVLDRAFSGVARMILIGDPKQAIYAFRGGDVHTYLTAAATAGVRKTLGVNWRSDHDLLASVQCVLAGARLGDERIVVHPVAAQHGAGRLVGSPHHAPLLVRVAERAGFGGRGDLVPVRDVRPHIAGDLARDVRALLGSGATFAGRPLEPRDVAVIAYAHKDLARAREALHALGVPAVVAGGGSVFATPAARQWLTLLEALETPHRSARVRAAALTDFLGVSAAALDEGGDELTDRLSARVRLWSELLTTRGVAAVLEAAEVGGLPARVLARVGGERDLTDLGHIGEVLHEMAVREHTGLVAMVAWLRRQIDDPQAGAGERTRRLDSDAAAVQLVTIHASKGLEYPVVYLPALFDRWVGEPGLLLFHDDADERVLDVGGGGPQWADHVERWRAEEAAEVLRLLYVAVTRAKSQVVAWWAPTSNTTTSALHRLLLGRSPGMAEVPVSRAVDDDATVRTFLDRWADQPDGPQWLPAVWAEDAPRPPLRAVPDLAARSFDRAVDLAWRRTSYSSLTRVEPEQAGVGSEPEVEVTDDESLPPLTPDSGAVTSADGGSGADVPSPMADLPVGATFGSLVHAVLEHTDPLAPDHDGDLRAALRARIGDELAWWPVALEVEVLVEALVAVLTTPLGPLAEGRTLAEIPWRDRLAELDFEVPLDGGDRARAPGSEPDVRLGDLAPLLRRYLPEGDPVRRFADALDRPALGGQSLRGYLTGSVDVVLRLRDPDDPTDAAAVRYLVVDYKTNRLGPPQEPMTAAHYDPAALVEAMGHSDYPLQALLYAAVLHRFLRWRQPGYDPERHLGGVLYLYLRGMCGPDTPRVAGQPTGVFSWRPPSALVVELSDLLDGGAR